MAATFTAPYGLEQLSESECITTAKISAAVAVLQIYGNAVAANLEICGWFASVAKDAATYLEGAFALTAKTVEPDHGEQR